MLRLDFIPKHPELKVYQDDTMFCINMDTMVLGEFLNIHRNDVVMDMGTNQGALLLYASLFHPKKMIGLEINENAIELAKKNMAENNIDYAEIRQGNIITYTEDPVDVIICNPPYFKTKEDNKSNNGFKNLAKHEGDLTIDTLIASIGRNLRDGGTLYFLFLTSRLDECILELKKNNLIPKVMKFVFDERKEYSNVFLVKCVKNAKQGMVVEKPVIIRR